MRAERQPSLSRANFREEARRLATLNKAGGVVFIGAGCKRPPPASMGATGRPFWPVPGSTRWGDFGPIGVWGQPGCPLRLHIGRPNGRIEPATRAEFEDLDRRFGLAEFIAEMRRDFSVAAP